MDFVNTPIAMRVYYAARDGMAISLYSLLSQRTPSEINTLLNKPILVEDGQECTPLIIAARNGWDIVVKMILSKFDVDIEQEGVVKFDGYTIEGASALWCAASAGHLDVVKTLVNKGASVNHATHSNSTPLRAACFGGRLDIVRYLVHHKADISIANKYNNTCLMIASYKGHIEIVWYLLERGADTDARDRCGATALHFAAEGGHMHVVRELYESGAKFVKNNNGMTPLITAAERTNEAVVVYLAELGEITIRERVEAYELLGASFANDKDNYSLTKAYKYLEVAMLLRYEDPDNILRKKLGPPIPAYENWIECETLQELESIRHSRNSLHMESLAVRERVLGAQNPEVTHPVVFRGAVFADDNQFDRCVELWLHALHLRQNNKIAVVKDLLRFAQVFSQIIHLKMKLEIDHVLSVLRACARELRKNKQQLAAARSCSKEDVEAIMAERDCNIMTTLYNLAILTKITKWKKISSRFDENDPMQRAVVETTAEINRLNLRLRNKQTLLHLAVNCETPVDDFHTNDVCRFPCAETARLLVRCGADVDALDADRNTPLHLIVNYQKPVSDFHSLHAIILTLLEEGGAHPDVVNRKGETPMDACSTGVSEIILRTQRKISLKCLAARVIKFLDIDYKGQVPLVLESFIELHGTGV